MININSKSFVFKPVLTLLILTLLAVTFKAYSQDVIQVNKATTKQTIWGFGGAANHPTQDLKNYLSAANQQIVLDKLFRTDGNNAGLSIIRLEINGFRKTDADPNNREQYTFEPSDGVWDWNTDQYQRWFADEALLRRNDIHFLSCVWSPPGWMKTNGSPINGGSLSTAYYDKYATYMKTYVDHYRNTYGYDIRWVSVQNEPTNSTPYASCFYTNSQLDIVAAKVADAIHSLNQGVYVGAPEGATRGISATFMSAMSSTTKGKLDFLLTHDYTGATTALAGYGKPVINTEVWSENYGYDDVSITDGLKWANAIQAALVARSETGWLYWWLIDPNGGAQGLIPIKSDGTYTIPKRLYAMGQFSRFMREGDIRVDATSTNGNLAVTASKNASGASSIVVVNNSSSAITTTVKGLSSSSLEVYRTSSTESLSKLTDISVAAGSATVTFAAKSITSLVEPSCANALPTINTPTDKTFESGIGVQSIDLSGISDGDACTQGVTITATSSNSAVVSVGTPVYTSCNATGTLSVNPLASGSAIITLTATDGGSGTCGSASKSVTFTVNVTQTISIPSKVEAEAYSTMSGVQTETTNDTGGGLNVGWIATGDWMTYNVNVAQSGTYSVSCRVAGWTDTGIIALQNSSNTTLTTINVPNGGTGAYQVWTTVNGQNNFNLAAGPQTIRIYATGPSWNINWFEIKSVSTSILTTIEVTPATSTINATQTKQFTAVGKDQFGAVMAVTPTWSANAPNGLFTGSTAGTYTVTATSGAITGSASIIVNPLVLTTIAVTPATATINATQTQQFTAVGKDQLGNTMTVTPTWTATGGTISTSGLFTGSTTGSFTVTATSGTVAGSASITVNPLVLTTITVTPATATIIAGQTQQYAAVGKDQLGNIMAITPVWSATGGTISTSGLFTGSASGAFTVKATSGIIVGSASITVSPLVVTTIAVTPATATLVAGQTQQFAASAKDQFGNAIAFTPTWAATGGTISTSGLYTSATAGTQTVTATSGTVSATATVTVTPNTSDPLLLSYFLVVDKYTADYMRPTDGSATAVITQYESATVPTMSSFQWEFRTATTSGYYYIINKWTGNAIYPTGASATDGIGVSQVALTTSNQNNTEMQWVVTASDEANYYWIKNRKSGLAIRPTGGTNGTGIAIVQNALVTTYSSFKWSLVSQGLKSAFIENCNEEVATKELTIYPNPVEDELLIKNADQNSTIEIFNLSGKLIKTKKFETENNILNVSSLKSGLYILKSTGNTHTSLTKFIKK